MANTLGDNTQLPADIGARIRQAQGRIRTYPKAGSFILPEENTWAAHAMLVKDPHNAIDFNPKSYPAFDGVLASRLALPGLSERGGKYEGLRTNFAVIRNVILNHYHATRLINGSDDAIVPTLQSIAEALIQSLTSQKQGLKSISRGMNLDIAGIEGIGAAKLYAHLAEIQDKPALWQPLMKNVKAMFNRPERAWDLPKLEDSPFSMHGLAAPPPNFLQKTLPDTAPRTKNSDPEFEERVKEAVGRATPPPAPVVDEPLAPEMQDMCDISEDVIAQVGKLANVDSLAEPTKDESVEEARKILRWLRNLEFTERDIEEFIDQGTPQAQVAKKQAVQKLIKIAVIHLQVAQRKNARASQDSALQAAREALEAMALTVAEHTRNLLPDLHARAKKLEALMEEMEETALLRQQQSMVQLLDTIELGVERATGQEVSDLSAASRLELLSARLREAAFELNGTEPLKPPTREEPFEHVRDTLAKLRHQAFSERPIDDLVRNGTPQEKAAFAQQVVEMSDALRNIAAEAQNGNPNILDDPDLKQLTGMVGNFAHAVSLMAAKEIPNSAAATQQISADVARMPEEWGDLHDRTVDRIVKHAEGALEKQLGDMAMEQDDMEEDLMKEAIEAALQTSDQAKRKKKKKRGEGKHKSGKGYKKQKKALLDVTADDYVLKQGRFAEDTKLARNDYKPAAMPVVIPGIKAEDLEAIRKLGGSLLEIGNQLKGLSASITAIPSGAAIAPDDKTVSQRTIEREQQTQTRGPQGPRV